MRFLRTLNSRYSYLCIWILSILIFLSVIILHDFNEIYYNSVEIFILITSAIIGSIAFLILLYYILANLHQWCISFYNRHNEAVWTIGVWSFIIGISVIPSLLSKSNTNEFKQSSFIDYDNGYKCGRKRYCNQMSTCSEAYFYLEECNLYRLDGDDDGVPCESICD